MQCCAIVLFDFQFIKKEVSMLQLRPGKMLFWGGILSVKYYYAFIHMYSYNILYWLHYIQLVQ